EPINHAVGTCYRCKTVIEPNLSKQWFVKTGPLAQKAAQAVRDERTVFVPKNWEKTYFEWVDNIRDWCISRQLWWGHQIPAWHCQHCGQTVVSRQDPSCCPACQGALTRDLDVLDTWFSSALWPFSTLGWPDKTPDLARYYPTTVLVTGFDIIFFWVARMMMMGLHFMGEVPFKTVLIHPLVRDADGQKMSKSKGNVIDPLNVIDKYGADAFRFTLSAMSGHGRDIKLNDDRISGYGKFVNKLWNAAKLVLSNVGEAQLGAAPTPQSLPDRWIHSRLSQTATLVGEHLDNFHFDKASDTIYHFVWDEFCDWYLELIKPALYGDNEELKAQTQENMLYALSVILRLLHPFMPFVTEELWAKLPGGSATIMTAPFPQGSDGFFAEDAINSLEFLMGLTKAVRQVRADFGVPPATKLSPLIKINTASLGDTLAQYSTLLLKLVGAEKLTQVEVSAIKPKDAALSVFPWGEVWTPLAGHIDPTAEMSRLIKELNALAKDMKSAESKLNNHDYLKKAPEEIVEETRQRLKDMAVRHKTLEQSLATLKEMEQ
ncbi:MAG: class I tRNA ligase family protein, partial [Candidatus Adiutrix sp.]